MRKIDGSQNVMKYLFLFRNDKYMKISRSIIAPLVLTILASALYRIMPNRPMGFAPQIAIALFSGAICMNNKKWAFAMPLISMFISDLFFEVLYINHLTDYQGFYSGQWLNYILIAGLAAFGFLIQTKKVAQFPVVLVGSQFWTGLVDWIKEVMLKKEQNIHEDDLLLFSVVDTADEAVNAIIEFYEKYVLKPNF